MSGVLLQTFTRNPLADSGTLGINAGAGVIITLAISKLEVTDPFYIRYLPFIATFGGMMTVALIYLISHQKGQAISPVKLIIAGVTLSTILSSSMIAITGRVNQNKLTYVVSWLAGKITGNNWESLAIAGPFLLLFWLLTYLRSHKLNILSLNDETALGLGLHLKRERQITLLLASALVAFSLSLAGNIVFIGMLASHISKRFLPSDHRLLFPAAMLLGASRYATRCLYHDRSRYDHKNLSHRKLRPDRHFDFHYWSPLLPLPYVSAKKIISRIID